MQQLGCVMAKGGGGQWMRTVLRNQICGFMEKRVGLLLESMKFILNSSSSFVTQCPAMSSLLSLLQGVYTSVHRLPPSDLMLPWCFYWSIYFC